MLRTRKSSELDGFTFATTAENLQELQEPAGVAGIFPNCDADFRRVRYCVGFMKSSGPIRSERAMAVAIECCEDICFENRKKRPWERGRRKRRKGKWDPMDRLWNSATFRGGGSGYLIEQD